MLKLFSLIKIHPPINIAALKFKKLYTILALAVPFVSKPCPITFSLRCKALQMLGSSRLICTQ